MYSSVLGYVDILHVGYVFWIISFGFWHFRGTNIEYIASHLRISTHIRYLRSKRLDILYKHRFSYSFWVETIFNVFRLVEQYVKCHFRILILDFDQKKKRILILKKWCVSYPDSFINRSKIVFWIVYTTVVWLRLNKCYKCKSIIIIRSNHQ